MTCIVGLSHKGVVYIGGDSAGIGSNYNVSIRSDPKVFINDKFIMGFTTSFRMGQLLAHAFKPPILKPKQDVYSFMVTEFIDAIRTCFKNGGYAKSNQNVESGGTFLVGFKGRLFSIHDDYQVGETVNKYSAVGCGEAYALGSMYTSQESKDPMTRIYKALDAAASHNAGVAPPYKVLQLGRK